MAHTFLSFISFVIISFGVHAQTVTPFTEAEIGQIVIVVNQIDIDAGKSIKGRSKSHQVNGFASYMVADHTQLKKTMVHYLDNHKLTARESSMSKSLKEEGTQKLSNLKSLNGAALEKSYIENEVAYHEKALEVLSKLIPQAKSVELKKLLTETRSTLTDHLEHAKKVQLALK